jgi:hypothetical protein
VGDFGPGLKGWDFGKGTRREIFDVDVPYQLEAQEMLLDWVFDRLSITGVDDTIRTDTTTSSSSCRCFAWADLSQV